MAFDNWKDRYVKRTQEYIQPPEILKNMGCDMKKNYEVEIEILGHKIKGIVYCEPGQVKKYLEEEIKTKLKVVKIKNK